MRRRATTPARRRVCLTFVIGRFAIRRFGLANEPRHSHDLGLPLALPPLSGGEPFRDPGTSAMGRPTSPRGERSPGRHPRANRRVGARTPPHVIAAGTPGIGRASPTPTGAQRHAIGVWAIPGRNELRGSGEGYSPSMGMARRTADPFFGIVTVKTPRFNSAFRCSTSASWGRATSRENRP